MIENILDSPRPSLLAALLALLAVAYCTGYVVYALAFSPISKIPGPWLNKLTKLPTTMANLRNLVHLNVKGNPLKFPPRAIMSNAAPIIIKYMNDYLQGEDEGLSV